MKAADLDPRRLMDRRAEFKLDWERRLGYLVMPPQETDFEAAWACGIDLLKQVRENMRT